MEELKEKKEELTLAILMQFDHYMKNKRIVSSVTNPLIPNKIISPSYIIGKISRTKSFTCLFAELGLDVDGDVVYFEYNTYRGEKQDKYNIFLKPLQKQLDDFFNATGCEELTWETFCHYMEDPITVPTKSDSDHCED